MLYFVLREVFFIGGKSRCDHQFGTDLNQYILMTKLRELRFYQGCRSSHDFDSRTITISHLTLAENTLTNFGVTRNKEILMSNGLAAPSTHPPGYCTF